MERYTDPVLLSSDIGSAPPSVHRKLRARLRHPLLLYQVTRIAEALAQTDLAARLHACPLDTFTAAAIYPDIWDDPAEYPALEQELHDWYNVLRDYYHHAAAAQCGVLVNIG